LKGYSRRRYYRAFLAERQDDSLKGLDEAFRHFGGLTEQVLCDNASLRPHSRFSARGPGCSPPRMGKEKMAENGAFSRAKSANFPCLEPGLLNTSR
jgi:transposase